MGCFPEYGFSPHGKHWWLSKKIKDEIVEGVVDSLKPNLPSIKHQFTMIRKDTAPPSSAKRAAQYSPIFAVAKDYNTFFNRSPMVKSKRVLRINFCHELLHLSDLLFRADIRTSRWCHSMRRSLFNIQFIRLSTIVWKNVSGKLTTSKHQVDHAEKKGSCYHEFNQRDKKTSSYSSVRSQRDRWEVSWTGAAIFAGE